MNRRESTKWLTFRRILQFGEFYKSRILEGSPLRRAFTKLATAVGAFNEDAAAERTRARDGRKTLQVSRGALVFRLDAIARTAEVIAHTVPGFDARFRLPRPKRDPVILATGHGFLREAEPFTAQFVEHGLPETFLGDLRTALTEYEAAVNVRETGKVARAAVQARLRKAQDAGREAVDAIDVIVRYQFADDAEMQNAWQRARRQDGLPLPKEDPAPSTDPSSTVTPTATTTNTTQPKSPKPDASVDEPAA